MLKVSSAQSEYQVKWLSQVPPLGPETDTERENVHPRPTLPTQGNHCRHLVVR